MNIQRMFDVFLGPICGKPCDRGDDDEYCPIELEFEEKYKEMLELDE